MDVATAIAVGVANDSAQGHETTSTAIAAERAVDGSEKCQNTNVANAMTSTAETKWRAIASACTADSRFVERSPLRETVNIGDARLRRWRRGDDGDRLRDVQGTREHAHAGTLRDQGRFAGEGRFIDLGDAVDDLAVNGDSRSGWDDDAVAGLDRIERHGFDGAVRLTPSRFRQQREPAVAAHQTSARLLFQIPCAEQQKDEHRDRIEIDLTVTGDA